MKLFLHYLRSKALKIGAFLLFALLFLVSFRLYHLPLAAVWYPCRRRFRSRRRS